VLGNFSVDIFTLSRCTNTHVRIHNHRFSFTLSSPPHRFLFLPRAVRRNENVSHRKDTLVNITRAPPHARTAPIIIRSVGRSVGSVRVVFRNTGGRRPRECVSRCNYNYLACSSACFCRKETLGAFGRDTFRNRLQLQPIYVYCIIIPTVFCRPSSCRRFSNRIRKKTYIRALHYTTRVPIAPSANHCAAIMQTSTLSAGACVMYLHTYYTQHYITT